MPEDFDVPEGTVFKDISKLPDDEAASLFSIDVRDLEPVEREALWDAIRNLDSINAWLTSEPVELP